MKKHKAKCEVCFYARSGTFHSTQLITCRQCKKVAHRYCYLPELEGTSFLCDQCEFETKNAKCCICNNEGLLKKTQEGEYGHPVCLMISKESLVKNYHKLAFHYLKSKRKTKSEKCNICNKNGLTSDLLTCLDKNCTKSAHFYCILQEHCKDNEEQNKWVQELKIFDNVNFDFVNYSLQKVRKYIKLFSHNAYKSIFGAKKISEQAPVFILYCRQHCENLRRCYCESIEDDASTQIDWIFCDSCSEWYHFSCEGITDQQDQSAEYVCKCCRTWHKKLQSKQDPIIKHYPRMYFYDLVQVQVYAEAKSYRLSQQMHELLRRVPFVCSLKYFNEIEKGKTLTGLINSVNFMTVKKLIIDKTARTELHKLLTKNKNLQEVIWKLDYVVSTESISAIMRAKRNEFTIDHMLDVFQKFEKKYSQGLNIMKPAVKQLLKIKNSVKKEEEQDIDVKLEEEEEVRNAVGTVKIWIADTRKYLCINKASEQCLHKFYKMFQEIEYLKLQVNELAQKKQFKELFRPLLTYNDEKVMTMDVSIKHLYRRLLSMMGKFGQHSLKLKYYKKCLDKYFDKCSPVVRRENIGIWKQMEVHKKDEANNFIAANKKHESKLLQKYIYQCQDEDQLENMWLVNLKNEQIKSFFQNIQMYEESLNSLCTELQKFCKSEEQQQHYPQFKTFIELHKAFKKLIESLNQGTVLQGYKINLNYLECIKGVKIDQANIYKFCQFFVSVFKLEITSLNPKIQPVIKDKSIEFLNLIQSRSMIFQCELQFKAAASLMQRYNFQRPKIIQIIALNKELLEILSSVSIKCLEEYQFVGNCLAKLYEAKQLCHENNLEFRISKIEYMIKLFELKQEAFQYFPEHIILSDRQRDKLITKKNITITDVDYCVVKKFLYKMKILKYPSSDHFFRQLHALYNQKSSYLNTLNLHISNYAALLCNQPVRQEQKLKVQEIRLLMQSRVQDLISCRPEEDQMNIMCDLHDKYICQMDEIIKSNTHNFEEMIKLYRQFLKLPFESDSNPVFIRFCTILHSIVEKRGQNGEVIQITGIVKRVQLDETSAKGEYSNKSNKNNNGNNILDQLKNKPRSINFQEIQKIYQRLLNQPGQQSVCSSLQKSMSTFKDMHQNCYQAISKFVKGSPFSLDDVEMTRKLVKTYEGQVIKDEIIDKMVKELQIYEEACDASVIESNDRFRELTKSFYSLLFNRPVPSQIVRNQNTTNMAAISSNRRAKFILKK